jgi:predicted permease
VLGRTTDGRPIGLSLPDYRDIKAHDRAFVDLAASSMVFASLGRGANAERVLAELVTGNYFHALGVGAALGRTLQPSDDVAPASHPVAVLSHSLWRRNYASDPAIVGRTIHLNGAPLTVVGVAAPGFDGTVVGMGIDVFAPIMMQPQVSPPSRLESRGISMMMTLGHLRPGVSVSQAAAGARVLAAQLDAEAPVPNLPRRTTVVPIWQSPFGAQTYWLPAVVVLGGMGLLILLVVCANVANLVLARSLGRRGELAVRLALGASRVRVLRLLFVENLVLAVPGALAGVALASAALPWFAAGAAAAAPSRVSLDTSVDAYVLAFALVLSCGCALIFGFVPALRTSRVDLSSLISDASPRAATRGRLRGLLVVSQVAVSLVLLVGAALVLRSYAAARQADAGFDAAYVTAVALDLQTAGYDEAAGLVLYTRLLDALHAEPLFESASLALNVPLSLVDNASRAVTIEDYAPRDDEDMIFLLNAVAPDYFRTLRIPLVAGREFARTDDAAGTPAAIVNETLARRLWQTPDQAIGRRLRNGSDAWRTVIGVARDVKYSRLSEPPRPFVYYPLLQSYASGPIVHARAAGDPAAAVRRVLDHVQALDPNIPILRATTVADQTRVALSVYELGAGALTMFGLLTMALAAIGIYGLVAYSVRQSTHEIGIRLAVGASRADVVVTFVRRGVALAAAGSLVGLLIALLMSRALGALLYGVSSRDVTSFAGATALVMAIALAASFAPAWQAAKTDPLGALRHR